MLDQERGGTDPIPFDFQGEVDRAGGSLSFPANAATIPTVTMTIATSSTVPITGETERWSMIFKRRLEL